MKTTKFTNSKSVNRELLKRPNQHQEFDRPSVDVSVNDGSVSSAQTTILGGRK